MYTLSRGYLFHILQMEIKHTNVETSTSITTSYPSVLSSRGHFKWCELCAPPFHIHLSHTMLQQNMFSILDMLIIMFRDFEAYATCKRLLEWPKINILYDNNSNNIMIIRHTPSLYTPICIIIGLGHGSNQSTTLSFEYIIPDKT